MNPRQKARDLIELAADDRTPEKERVAAAWKAVELIRGRDCFVRSAGGPMGAELSRYLSDAADTAVVA